MEYYEYVPAGYDGPGDALANLTFADSILVGVGSTTYAPMPTPFWRRALHDLIGGGRFDERSSPERVERCVEAMESATVIDGPTYSSIQISSC
jgi:hypothetical protein